METGGNLYGGKLTSVWGTDTTSQFTFNYNNKTAETDFAKTPLTGAYQEVHEGYTNSAGESSPVTVSSWPETTTQPEPLGPRR